MFRPSWRLWPDERLLLGFNLRRFLLVARGVVALSLVACGGEGASSTGISADAKPSDARRDAAAVAADVGDGLTDGSDDASFGDGASDGTDGATDESRDSGGFPLVDFGVPPTLVDGGRECGLEAGPPLTSFSCCNNLPCNGDCVLRSDGVPECQCFGIVGGCSAPLVCCYLHGGGCTSVPLCETR
jgi:hypothetical protein